VRLCALRGHAQARGGGGAVGLDPVEHFVGQRVDLALAVLEHAHENDMADAPHDPARGQPREADPVGSHPEGARHEALEREPGELHPLSGLGPDAERVDEHQPGSLGLLGDVVEQRLAAGVQAVGPPALGAPGVEHALAGAGHDDVVGGQEALFLVGEQLVERAPRDTREPDHVRHRRGLIAPLRNGLDHRTVETRPLVACDLVSTHTAGPVGQPAVQRCDLAPGSTHPHCSER
jgi:hypothetical protein